MAIEIARGVHAAAPASTATSHGKSAAPDAPDSFGAVLASMDEAPVADTPEEAVEAADSAVPGDAVTASASALAAAAASSSTPPVETAPVAADPSALLLAQSTLGAAGLVVDAQAVPAAPGLPTTPLAPRPAVATPGVAKDTGSVATPAAALGVALLGRADGKQEAGKDPLRATAMPDAGAVAATRQAAVTATAAATDAATAARALAPATEAVAVVPAMTAALANDMPAPWRRLERAPDGIAVHAGLATGNDTALAASPFITAPDAAGASVAGHGAGFTERLVEQVSWWMANRSQGAELKLDLPGGTPVSVSVQITGNEAHVAFRSDSPEARQWLGAALPQLKEMFGNEGLMLSGASVGQSGTGAEQEAARDAQRALRSNAGTGGSGSVDTAPAPAARPRTVTERALDLYV